MVGERSVCGHPQARQGVLRDGGVALPGFAALRALQRWLQQAGVDHAPGRLSAKELVLAAGKGSWALLGFLLPCSDHQESVGLGFFSIILLHPSRLNSVVSPV